MLLLPTPFTNCICFFVFAKINDSTKNAVIFAFADYCILFCWICINVYVYICTFFQFKFDININSKCIYLFSSQECVNHLNLRSLVSISMDEPTVNFKFLELFQQEYAELNGGASLFPWAASDCTYCIMF